MFCYCLAQCGGYIHLLTPFLPLGSAVTDSNRRFIYQFCLPSNAHRAQQHCSHRSPPPTAGSHHVCTSTIPSVSSLHHTFLSHTAESPFPSLQCKTPLVGWSPGWEMQGSLCHGRLLPALQGHSQKIPGQEAEYAWVTPACHVGLHQGTPSPRQPSGSPSAISSSGMKMQNDKPLSCGVFPRALTFPIQSLLPQTPKKLQNPQSSVFFSSSVAVTQHIQSNTVLSYSPVG